MRGSQSGGAGCCEEVKKRSCRFIFHPSFPLLILAFSPAMKVRTAVKRLCDTCRIVLRRGRVYVVCKANPKVVCVVRGCGRRAGAEACG